jgi:hypothetical protein
LDCSIPACITQVDVLGRAESIVEPVAAMKSKLANRYGVDSSDIFTITMADLNAPRAKQKERTDCSSVVRLPSALF